jgi:tetratricopeptide (TPR) repeat protein
MAMRGRLVDALSNGPLWIEIANLDWLGCACYNSGHFNKAAQVFRLAMDKLDCGENVILSDVEGDYGRSLLALGQVQNAMESITRCLQLHERYASDTGRAYWMSKLGEVMMVTGNYMRALTLIEGAIELSEGTRDEHFRVSGFTSFAATTT